MAKSVESFLYFAQFGDVLLCVKYLLQTRNTLDPLSFLNPAPIYLFRYDVSNDLVRRTAHSTRPLGPEKNVLLIERHLPTSSDFH